MINSSNEFMHENDNDSRLDDDDGKKIIYRVKPRTYKEKRKIPEPTLFYDPKLVTLIQFFIKFFFFKCEL